MKSTKAHISHQTGMYAINIGWLYLRLNHQRLIVRHDIKDASTGGNDGTLIVNRKSNNPAR